MRLLLKVKGGTDLVNVKKTKKQPKKPPTQQATSVFCWPALKSNYVLNQQIYFLFIHLLRWWNASGKHSIYLNLISRYTPTTQYILFHLNSQPHDPNILTPVRHQTLCTEDDTDITKSYIYTWLSFDSVALQQGLLLHAAKLNLRAVFDNQLMWIDYTDLMTSCDYEQNW